MLISIDPGKHSLGWARFDDERLTACGLLRWKDWASMAGGMSWMQERLGSEPSTLIVIEVPQVYRQRFWKGDPNDLIDVALVAGAAGMIFGPGIKFIRPHEWKGGRGKNVDHPLTLSRLSSSERVELDKLDVPKSLRHNVLDAIGIGLWKLGRR